LYIKSVKQVEFITVNIKRREKMVEHLDPETSPITQWFDLIYLHNEADDICGKSRELLLEIKGQIENLYLKKHKIFFPEEYNFSENELETLRFLKTLPTRFTKSL
jgi:hypothetical protein